jgi:hypothetical protein
MRGCLQHLWRLHAALHKLHCHSRQGGKKNQSSATGHNASYMEHWERGVLGSTLDVAEVGSMTGAGGEVVVVGGMGVVQG